MRHRRRRKAILLRTLGHVAVSNVLSPSLLTLTLRNALLSAFLLESKVCELIVSSRRWTSHLLIDSGLQCGQGRAYCAAERRRGSDMRSGQEN